CISFCASSGCRDSEAANNQSFGRLQLQRLSARPGPRRRHPLGGPMRHLYGDWTECRADVGEPTGCRFALLSGGEAATRLTVSGRDEFNGAANGVAGEMSSASVRGGSVRPPLFARSEERRVGKECRSWW